MFTIPLGLTEVELEGEPPEPLEEPGLEFPDGLLGFQRLLGFTGFQRLLGFTGLKGFHPPGKLPVIRVIVVRPLEPFWTVFVTFVFPVK